MTQSQFENTIFLKSSFLLFFFYQRVKVTFSPYQVQLFFKMKSKKVIYSITQSHLNLIKKIRKYFFSKSNLIFPSKKKDIGKASEILFGLLEKTTLKGFSQ